ncbi:MAG: hydrogenase formation protein HypD [Deltaproteobacteria bacterium]|nr:hydrogenase formation protein HypD [Deltaproteobacteria bacterium]
MELYSDFKRKDDISGLISLIDSEVKKTINIMEICGGHTHSIMKYGLNTLLKDKINFLHGPGCPVCVMPVKRIDEAIEIADSKDVILAAYGDMMRVPGTDSSLIKERAKGKDVRMVYSPLDIIKIALDKTNKDKKIVFFAIGFETTTPMTAALLEEVISRGINNVLFHVNHVLVPPPIKAILDSGDNLIDGFICPGHVSVMTGSGIYNDIPDKYAKAAVIAGFEPYDILSGVLLIVRQINESRPAVEIAYKRAVKEGGNMKAQALVNKYFTVRDEFEWRGFGNIPKSGLKLRDEFKDFDAEYFFSDELKELRLKTESCQTGRENAACKCGEILKGKSKPDDCPLFGKACNPENPVGACMVSFEGACAAYYKYRNF